MRPLTLTVLPTWTCKRYKSWKLRWLYRTTYITKFGLKFPFLTGTELDLELPRFLAADQKWSWISWSTTKAQIKPETLSLKNKGHSYGAFTTPQTSASRAAILNIMSMVEAVRVSVAPCVHSRVKFWNFSCIWSIKEQKPDMQQFR